MRLRVAGVSGGSDGARLTTIGGHPSLTTAVHSFPSSHSERHSRTRSALSLHLGRVSDRWALVNSGRDPFPSSLLSIPYAPLATLLSRTE